jgi:hypothetical protein
MVSWPCTFGLVTRQSVMAGEHGRGGCSFHSIHEAKERGSREAKVPASA